jgi:hypothetical protein
MARNASPIRRADRGSRPKRLREGRLRRLPSCGVARARVSAAARAQPPSQGARPQRAGPVPGMRKERTSCGFNQVAAPERVSRHIRARHVPGTRPSPASRPMPDAQTSNDFAISLPVVTCPDRAPGVSDVARPGILMSCARRGVTAIHKRWVLGSLTPPALDPARRRTLREGMTRLPPTALKRGSILRRAALRWCHGLSAQCCPVYCAKCSGHRARRIVMRAPCIVMALSIPDGAFWRSALHEASRGVLLVMRRCRIDVGDPAPLIISDIGYR